MNATNDHVRNIVYLEMCDMLLAHGVEPRPEEVYQCADRVLEKSRSNASIEETDDRDVIENVMSAVRSYFRCRDAAQLRYALERDYGPRFFPNKCVPSLIPMSAAARQRREEFPIKGKLTHHKLSKIGLAFEHKVPLSVLTKLLKTPSENRDHQEAGRILLDYFQVCWVTKEEDSKLNRLGLRSKMPAGWRDGDPANARYAMAGIDIQTPA